MSATYLVDKSALARQRHPAVAGRLGPLLADGCIATCALVDLEVLYSTRNVAEHDATRRELSGLRSVPITPEVTARAVDVQRDLARTGRHRIPIPDLIIAAAAELAGLRVLHYDADFERISTVTGQPHEWVVARGSL